MRTSLARRGAAAGAACFLLATGASHAAAQAWSYPSFQTPRVATREFNFGVADGGGTSLVAQWREAFGTRSHFGLDGGLVDAEGRASTFLLLGASFGYQLTDAREDLPLDFLGTGGVYFAIGDGGSVIRIPFGVSMGHTFALESGMSLTPYVHPRVSIDRVNPDGPGRSDTELGIDFDLGVNFQVNSRLAFRASALFGGSDAVGSNDGFGISLAWSPAPLSRR